MKHILLAPAVCILFAVPCLAQYEVGIPCESLGAYLRSAKADEKQETEARALVDKSQVIYLHYDNPEPSTEPAECSRFALSIKASLVVPIWQHAADGKTYPEIDIVFSKLFGDNSSTPGAGQWLDEMKRPLVKGYVLTSVRVILTPTEEVKKGTDVISNGIVTDFVSGLAGLKSQFPELESFDPKSIRETGVSFVHGLGPASKAGRERTDKQWVEVNFWIGPVTGNPRQQFIPTKVFSHQAVEACWRLDAANSQLKDRLTLLVASLLKRLDAREDELSRNTGGTTTPRTVP